MGFNGYIMGFSQPTLAYYNGDAWESEVVNGEFAVFFVLYMTSKILMCLH